MITKRGKPITGARLPQRRPFVLANQAETSSTLQRQLRNPDIPQQDSQLRPPAPTNSAYRANQQFQKDAMRYGGTGQANSAREMSDPNFGAVGYERGATKPKAGNPIISGSPLRGSKRVAGDGSFPLAKASSSYATGRASMAKIGLGKAYEDYKRYGG